MTKLNLQKAGLYRTANIITGIIKVIYTASVVNMSEIGAAAIFLFLCAIYEMILTLCPPVFWIRQISLAGSEERRQKEEVLAKRFATLNGLIAGIALSTILVFFLSQTYEKEILLAIALSIGLSIQSPKWVYDVLGAQSVAQLIALIATALSLGVTIKIIDSKSSSSDLILIHAISVISLAVMENLYVWLQTRKKRTRITYKPTFKEILTTLTHSRKLYALSVISRTQENLEIGSASIVLPVAEIGIYRTILSGTRSIHSVLNLVPQCLTKTIAEATLNETTKILKINKITVVLAIILIPLTAVFCQLFGGLVMSHVAPQTLPSDQIVTACSLLLAANIALCAQNVLRLTLIAKSSEEKLIAIELACMVLLLSGNQIFGPHYAIVGTAFSKVVVEILAFLTCAHVLKQKTELVH